MVADGGSTSAIPTATYFETRHARYLEYLLKVTLFDAALGSYSLR